jgi:hypothetical protein
MSSPIPSPTMLAIEAEGGVEVVRGGKKRKAPDSDIRNISQEVAMSLASKFGADRLSALFEELVVAECVTNGGKRIPDNRTRLAAAIYLSNQILGLPVQRQEIVSVALDADASIGLADRLKNSPALRKSLRAILNQVDEAGIVSE